MDEVRFNDEELLLIRDAVDGLWCSDDIRDPSDSERANQLRVHRKISKLLDHPKTEFV
jgi:hypothetical protein|tara:strand:+ start:582 stop:755 length:174 start_codon:yes stop_codon:yes gene_type:complete